MDQYQKYLINDKSKFYVLAEDQDDKFYNAFIDKQISIRQFNAMLTDCNSKTYREDVNVNEFIEVKQLPDIKIYKYFLFLYNKNFEKIYYSDNKEVKELLFKSEENLTCFGLQLNFKKPIENIKIFFNFNIADPITIPIHFIKTNEKEYYKKIEKEKHDLLLNKLNISHSCGQDLITIKFQNCNDDVCSTKITLFDDKKQIMGVFKVDEGMFYKSITNLAYDKYFYKIAQYDKNNSLLVKSDFVEFVIKPHNNGGGKMVVRCNY